MADLLPIRIHGSYKIEVAKYIVYQRIYYNGWKQHTKNRKMVTRLKTIKNIQLCQ